jgi:hypothetical protein
VSNPNHFFLFDILDKERAGFRLTEEEHQIVWAYEQEQERKAEEAEYEWQKYKEEQEEASLGNAPQQRGES